MKYRCQECRRDLCEFTMNSGEHKILPPLPSYCPIAGKAKWLYVKEEFQPIKLIHSSDIKKTSSSFSIDFKKLVDDKPWGVSDVYDNVNGSLMAHLRAARSERLKKNDNSLCDALMEIGFSESFVDQLKKEPQKQHDELVERGYVIRVITAFSVPFFPSAMGIIIYKETPVVYFEYIDEGSKS